MVLLIILVLIGLSTGGFFTIRTFWRFITGYYQAQNRARIEYKQRIRIGEDHESFHQPQRDNIDWRYRYPGNAAYYDAIQRDKGKDA